MQQMKHDEFRNEPFTDFSKEENARAMREALARVQSELGREYPLVIGGERVETGDILESINPARKTETVGRFHKATKELATQAVEKANEVFKTWSRTLPHQRADLLFRVAALLRERKHYFSAWMIHEVAKSWPEADGDTAEAIDFCEFYAREMLRYAGPQPLTRVEGEENRLEYIPLGVGVVIPPWNFPLAIMAGMTAASFVTGNTVVLKPSSDAPAFGFQGQKCSACSRAIIHADVYDSVVGRIVERAEKLKVGDPVEQATTMSAVINQKAFKTINDYVEKGKEDGGPVIADVKPGDRVEQEEIFGPVLACIRADDFDHALAIANDTEYGLTGAVYTNDPEKLERARREFHVGNLYLNRKCTGALVGVHPFGGFNMSGTDSKAGGRDYLGLFLQAKVVSEKIRPGYSNREKRGAI